MWCRYRCIPTRLINCTASLRGALVNGAEKITATGARAGTPAQSLMDANKTKFQLLLARLTGRA